MPSKEMGERFKQLRERAGLTQKEAAEKAGVPIGTLRGWEYGRREPLLSAAGRLAAALDVEIRALPEPPQRARPDPAQDQVPPSTLAALLDLPSVGLDHDADPAYDF